MSQSGCLLPKLLLYIVAVAELPCWCQTAVLKGRISDPLQKKPIPGAEVILLGIDGKQQGKTMSGADGLYSINQLKRGQRVSARYRRGGYAPDPRTYDIVLSQVENVNDVELLRDTSDASYWGAWSGAIKSFVDGQAADPNQQARIYEQAWSSLISWGVSAEAQAQAARQLTEAAPQALGSSRIADFASVDMDELRRFDVEMESAIRGTGKLSKWRSIPPSVAATVAFTELRKQSDSPSVQRRLLQEYSEVWGNENSDNLREKLAEAPKHGTDWEEAMQRDKLLKQHIPE